MQCGKKRAGLDEKGASGDLLDSAGDSESVQFAADERFQDEHVQGALQEGGRFAARPFSGHSGFFPHWLFTRVAAPIDSL